MSERIAGQNRSGTNQYGLLGELAGYKGPRLAWARKAGERLYQLYGGDAREIVPVVQEAILACRVPLCDQAGYKKLDQVRQDYASYWLLRQIWGDLLPSPDRQAKIWREAFRAAPDRYVPLTLALAGFDLLLKPYGDQSTLLHQFSFSSSPELMRVFLDQIPAEARKSQLNAVASDGSTPLHIAAFSAEPGTVSFMHGAGADLKAVMLIAFNRLGVISGNVAHVAVAHGRPEIVAELMSLDRNLFTKEDPQLQFTPHQIFSILAHRGEKLTSSQRAAANLSAFAVDAPMPFPEQAQIVEQLLPVTAPRPCLPELPLWKTQFLHS